MNINLLPFLFVMMMIATSDSERLIRQTTKNPAGRILSIVSGGNPFSNPCSSNDQCNNTLHECVADKKLNSSYWYCNCLCGGAPCNQSGDCCTNICDNGICSANGGKQGAVCSSLNPISCPSNTIQCADNYKCQPWGLFGYCNSNSSTFSCLDKPNGDYSDPFVPCDTKFYTCSNGYSYQRNCPSNLYFDRITDQCNAKTDVADCK